MIIDGRILKKDGKIMKKVIGILLLIVMILQATIVLAVSKQDLQNQQKENAANMQEIEETIEQIQAQKSATMKEVESLINQISDYKSQINELESQISDLQSKITQAEEQIGVKETEYEERRELANEVIVTMYEKGEMTYLDVLLSSASIVDFISNYFLISELTDYSIELLKTIEQERIEIENQKAELENDKKELDEAKASKEEKYNELKKAQEQKNVQVANLTAAEKEEQAELEKFKEDQREIEKELKRIEEEEAKKNNSKNDVSYTPSKSGYIFPVAGLSKANINNKSYPSYTGHTGVDVNINVIGKNVVAVKDGTVEISRAIKGSIKNYDSNGKYVGSYSSYGEYIVINHHDGTMTLYGHMKPGSRKVSVGQTVKQGQVIGIVGNTGNCLPRPTPSSPLRGTHLHFEVRVKGSPVNPLPYLP